jgi:hypothetical protein
VRCHASLNFCERCRILQVTASLPFLLHLLRTPLATPPKRHSTPTTLRTSALTTSTRSTFILEYTFIQYFHDIISKYPYNNYNNSALTTSTRSTFILEYWCIQYFHDIISKYPHNNVESHCRLYMQPQIHTACTIDYYVEQIFVSLNKD